MPSTDPVAPPSSPALQRAQIVAAAATCIRRDGAKATSMESVARALTAPRHAIYTHFKTRQALLLDVVATEGRRTVEELARTIEERDLSDPALAVAHAIALLATVGSTDPVLRTVLGTDADAFPRENQAVASVMTELMSAYWTIVLRKLDDRDLGHHDRDRTLRWLTFVHLVTVTSLVGDDDPAEDVKLSIAAATLRRHASRTLFGPAV